MIGHTTAFADAVRADHHITSKVEIERDGRVVRVLDVHSGSVDANRAAAVSRRFTAAVADDTGELTPAGIRDELAPFGTLVRPYRGVRHVVITNVEISAGLISGWEGEHVSTAVDPATGDLILGWVD